MINSLINIDKNFIDKHGNILLIGINDDSNMAKLKSFFKESQIYCINCAFENISSDMLNNIKNIQYRDEDLRILNLFFLNINFDYILDYRKSKTKEKISMFNFIFSKLQNGGIYYIEDIDHADFKKFANNNDIDFEQSSSSILIRK